MVTLDKVLKLIDHRKNRLLLLAQSALPESRFSAYRKLLLDELGKNGLESELKNLFNENMALTGKAKYGQE